MKINVKYSNKKEATEAGKELIENLSNEQNPKLGIIFSTINYDNKKLIEGVREKNFDIIGCTTSAGIMTQEGYMIDEEGTASIMTFEGEDFEISCYGKEKENNARETGKIVAEKILEKNNIEYAPDYFLILSSPDEEEEYIKGIQDVIGRVPCFGGSASDNTLEGKWNVFYNNNVFKDGVAVAFIYTTKEIKTKLLSPYKETKDYGIITKTKDMRTIEKINNKNAVDIYKDWCKLTDKDVKGNDIFTNTILTPLGIKNRLGEFIAIRHPIYTNEDGSIKISSNIAEKTVAIKMETTIDDLISSIIKTIKEINQKDEANGYLLIIDAGIRLIIGERMNEIYKALNKELKGIPFITLFSLQEYGYTDEQTNITGSLMVSITTF